MKLKEWIAYLQTFPPETEVITDKDDANYQTLADFKGLVWFNSKGENGPVMMIQN